MAKYISYECDRCLDRHDNYEYTKPYLLTCSSEQDNNIVDLCDDCGDLLKLKLSEFINELREDVA